MRWGKQRLRPPDNRQTTRLARSVKDREAFHEFYVAYAERIMAFFTRRLFDAEVAADLTGETFAVAFDRRSQWRGTTTEEEQGWLFAIARSQLTQYCRRGDVEREALRRLGLDPPTLRESDIDEFERVASLGELKGAIQAALVSLSPEQAYAVTQRVLQERSYTELASELEVSEQVIRARVSRGLKSMAESLEGSDVKELA